MGKRTSDYLSETSIFMGQPGTMGQHGTMGQQRTTWDNMGQWDNIGQHGTIWNNKRRHGTTRDSYMGPHGTKDKGQKDTRDKRQGTNKRQP